MEDSITENSKVSPAEDQAKKTATTESQDQIEETSIEEIAKPEELEEDDFEEQSPSRVDKQDEETDFPAAPLVTEPVRETEPAELSDNEEDSIDEIDDEMEQVEGEIEISMESVIEAVLFASDEPLTPPRLAKIAETEVRQVRGHVKSLNTKYRKNGSSFRIERIAGGYQMMTLEAYNGWISKLIKVRDDGKLSPAALETLAIVAYKQPIIRADIEAIRGVAAGEMIRNLMYKGLVKIVGRAEILGRPMQYGTTKKFLEVFGLNTLKDLPKIEELKKPSE